MLTWRFHQQHFFPLLFSFVFHPILMHECTVYIWESSTWRRGNGNRFSLLLTGSVSGSLFTPTMHTYMEGYLHKHTVTHLNKNNRNIVFLTSWINCNVKEKNLSFMTKKLVEAKLLAQDLGADNFVLGPPRPRYFSHLLYSITVRSAAP